MTREDVISWLEYLSDDARSKADGLVPTNIEIACGMAIDALKAQEPVRVAVVNNRITGLPVTHCPKCHESIDMFYAAKGIETKFCPWCGQAVKWE